MPYEVDQPDNSLNTLKIIVDPISKLL